MPALQPNQLATLAVLDWLLDATNYRNTGRTTTIAIGIIRSALKNPGSPVWYVDHHNTQDGRRQMRSIVAALLDASEYGARDYTLGQNQLQFRRDLPPDPGWLPAGWEGVVPDVIDGNQKAIEREAEKVLLISRWEALHAQDDL